MGTEEKFYLFIFEDNSIFVKSQCSSSFKDSVLGVAKYNGVSSELFSKSLKGFEDNDIDDIIAMYNMFICSPNDRIAKIYAVDKVLYDWNSVNAKECG